MPAEIDGQAIVASMRERSGVTIIGGQGAQRGKIVRFGHIGYVDVQDIAAALAGLWSARSSRPAPTSSGDGRPGRARGARKPVVA